MRVIVTTFIVLSLLLISGCGKKQDAAAPAATTSAGPEQPKPATEATKAAQKKVLDELPFSDKSDFDDAQKGFISRPDELVIKDEKGNVVWELESYKKYVAPDKEAPDTINPSLYRITMGIGELPLVPNAARSSQARPFAVSAANPSHADHRR